MVSDSLSPPWLSSPSIPQFYPRFLQTLFIYFMNEHAKWMTYKLLLYWIEIVVINAFYLVLYPVLFTTLSGTNSSMSCNYESFPNEKAGEIWTRSKPFYSIEHNSYLLLALEKIVTTRWRLCMRAASHEGLVGSFYSFLKIPHEKPLVVTFS